MACKGKERHPVNAIFQKVGVAITDITAGLFTHGAIMAALLARERRRAETGEWIGQKIDVSLMESQVSLTAFM